MNYFVYSKVYFTKNLTNKQKKKSTTFRNKTKLDADFFSSANSSSYFPSSTTKYLGITTFASAIYSSNIFFSSVLTYLPPSKPAM